jgi:hypothetical protein
MAKAKFFSESEIKRQVNVHIAFFFGDRVSLAQAGLKLLSSYLSLLSAEIRNCTTMSKCSRQNASFFYFLFKFAYPKSHIP